MLSSRYLHLHEALGLGPMWLNQNAKIIHAAPQAAASAAPVRKPLLPIPRKPCVLYPQAPIRHALPPSLLRKRPNRLSAFPKRHPKPLPKHRQKQKKPRIQTIYPVLT